MLLIPQLPGGVLVAVSGGADSTALAVLLAESGIASRGPLRLAHVRHGFRPDGDAGDAAAVEELGRRLGLAVDRLTIEPPSRATDAPIPEAFARAARYRALSAAARRANLPVIATGHHAADRRETQLLHLLRGGELHALRGMATLRHHDGLLLWRPLLDHEPEALRELLTSRGIPWRDDPSNLDLRLTRNRIRHRLLPGLVADQDPLATRLDRLSRLSSSLLLRAEKVAESLLRQGLPGAGADSWLWPAVTLHRLPPLWLRAFLDRIAERLAPDRPPRRRGRELAAVLAWIAAPAARGRIEVEPLRIHRTPEWCAIEPADAASTDQRRSFEAPPFAVPLAGVTSISPPRLRWRARVVHLPCDDLAGRDGSSGRFSATLPAATGLTLSTLGTGDHAKRCAASVPAFERTSWPAVRDAERRIVWLPGLGPPRTDGTIPQNSRPRMVVSFEELPDLLARDAAREDALTAARPRAAPAPAENASGRATARPDEEKPGKSAEGQGCRAKQ